MSEELLSIGEAARLIGVHENTLRDWDIEGKFKATRTSGNHRRYSLDQIRKYLDENEPKNEARSALGAPQVTQAERIEKEWAKTEHLDDVTEKIQRQTLAVLLENTKLYLNSISNCPFSTGQMFYLVRQGWKRSKLKKMVSTQPMLGPCSLVYFLKPTNNGVRVESDAVAARTQKYDFSIFADASFDNVKDLYAGAIAAELDYIVMSKLPKLDIESVIRAAEMNAFKLNNVYDYLVAPECFIDQLKPYAEGVDLIDGPLVLDPDSFLPRAAGGKYPDSYMRLPILSVYQILLVGPQKIGGTYSAMLRFGWFDGEKTKTPDDHVGSM